MTEKDKKYYDAMLAKIVWHIITALIFVMVINYGSTFFAKQRAKKREEARIEYVKQKEIRQRIQNSFHKDYNNGSTKTSK